MNKTQALYETRWKHTELNESVEKRLNKYMIDLGSFKKGQTMTTVIEEQPKKWTLEDLKKLKCNRFRPIAELEPILKNKYTAKEIADMKSRITNEAQLVKIEEQIAGEFKPAVNSVFDEEDYRQMYLDRNMPFNRFCFKHPEIMQKTTKNTLNWYLGSIRAELKGIQTSLSLKLYILLRKWHIEAGNTMPARGSNKIRSDAAKKLNRPQTERGKKILENKLAKREEELKSQTEPAIEVQEPEVPVQEVSVQEPIRNLEPIPDGEKVVNKEVLNPEEVGFTKNAQMKFGLMTSDGEMLYVGDTLAHIEGAEYVFRKYGFRPCLTRVKLLAENFS